MTRRLRFVEAVREALELALLEDHSVYVMGLGVPDPKGIFGSTVGLQERFGTHRVMDMPVSENGMTGVAIGSALVGMKPVLTHQRMDFALLAIEQIVNQAANWHYMFGGQQSVPVVIRLVIGRGWGQGPQHSQSLQAWFAHIPGLKVVMPTTAYDAKGLLLASIADPNPVLFIEHRWLHDLVDDVPAGRYAIPLGQAKMLREGHDVTIVSTSFMTVEALRAAARLMQAGISATVVDVRSLRPLDEQSILAAIRNTGRVVIADTGWKSFGVSAELCAMIVEQSWKDLRHPPVRIGLPDCPTPTSHALAKYFYPTADDIVRHVLNMFDKADEIMADEGERDSALLDVPDLSFAGPF
ncbi:MAG: alpha-ketoacid dehydrogenase subunit beta [Nitrospirae bacterium]|nr:MAG: alpha-ketoacid dehydrogenase subunit beta [Nitrospirota bacterium]